jgi:arylsulfatase A-like enzyme
VPSVPRLFVAQSGLLLAAWAASVASFVAQSSGIAERFAALARGPYLSVAVVAQLRVVPAYLVLAAVLTLLLSPVRRFLAGRLWLLRLAAADLLLLLLGLGPALLVSPGFFDTVERKLRVDLAALERLHVLEAATVVLVVLTLAAAGAVVRRWRWRLVGLGALAVLLVASSRHPEPPRATKLAKPNVLILAADSWRYDRLGVHGGRAGLTPALDAFAAGAIDFRQHHVATASTLESWTTMLTGQLPATHGLRSMYPSRAEVRAVEQRDDLLPKTLARAGYDTFVSSDWVGNHFDLVDYGFGRRDVGPVQNFEALLLEATLRAHPLVAVFFAGLPGPLGDAFIPGRASMAWAARPSVLTDRLFEGIDASIAAGRPFFGVLFLSPTHLPCNARHPFNARYAAPGYDGPHRYQVEVSAHELITTGFAPTLPPHVIEHVRDLYDGAVSDVDDTLGSVLRGLDARGLDDTIVIVTSDHGEDLYDPGSTLGHGTNFFGGDQSTRIPFLIRVPQRRARVVEAVTRSMDLAPTVLSLLGLEVPASMEGVSLTPLMDGTSTDLGLIVRAETCYLFFPKARAMTGLTEVERAGVVELAGAADTLEDDPAFRHNLVLRQEFRAAVIAAKYRMVRTARYKLIVIPGKTAPIVRLYDMVEDPQQRRDLSGQGLDVEVELRRLINSRE